MTRVDFDRLELVKARQTAVSSLTRVVDVRDDAWLAMPVCVVSTLHVDYVLNLVARAVVKELVETEEEFVTDMEHVVNVYYRQMDHPSTPRKVSDQRDALFGPFKQIQEFHKRFKWSKIISKSIQI